MNEKILTVRQAIEILQRAESIVGSDAALVLSLTSSGIPDATVNEMHVVHEDASRFVHVYVEHPDLSDSL